jgi:hypothetical protein
VGVGVDVGVGVGVRLTLGCIGITRLPLKKQTFKHVPATYAFQLILPLR